MAEKERVKIEEPEHHYGKGFEASNLSQASWEHPERNEDAAIINSENALFGVADGMGGHAAGEVASRLAREKIEEVIGKFPRKLTVEQTEEAVKTALLEANAEIMRISQKNPEYEGMGTTASIVKLWQEKEGAEKAIIGHVGDSRVYVMRKDGKLEQVTRDDSRTSQEVTKRAQEKIVQERKNPEDLPFEEREAFRTRNAISQALGFHGTEPHIYTIDIKEGEKIIITSDGVHDNLTDSEIEEILRENPEIQKATREIVARAYGRSRLDRKIEPVAKPDDMSAVLLDIQKQIKREPKEQKKLTEGEVVRVRRSSGQVEAGWKIREIHEESGKKIVNVVKEKGGLFMEKDIPLEELQKINP